MFCRSVWSNSGMLARDGRHHAFLLGDVELRGGAGIEALLDQVENAGGGGKVLARDPQPVLRHQHLQIGGADARRWWRAPPLPWRSGWRRRFPARRPGSRGSCPRNRSRSSPSARPCSPRARRRRAATTVAPKPSNCSPGSSGAPSTLAWASAWTMRAMAAPMLKLAVCASSIRPVSSCELNARHQSSAGGAESPFPAA